MVKGLDTPGHRHYNSDLRPWWAIISRRGHMRNRSRTATSLLVAALVFIATAVPAHASQSNTKYLTCTSSTGYSIIVAGSAKGYISHQVTGYSSTYVGKYTSFHYNATNTGIGGSRGATIHANNIQSPKYYEGVVQTNESRCGTL
jgi:hypothetical protein